MYKIFKILIVSIQLITLTMAATGQEPGSQRNIIVNSEDSLIKTSVWDKPYKHKIDPEINYHWYAAGTINHNVGGYSGKLVHGKYEMFDNEQKLRAKGTFEYGVMTGNWIRWYANGNTQWTGNYKDGKITGKVLTYTIDGKQASILSYKKGVLNGKSYFFEQDKTIVKKFRNGKEIVKVAKVKKEVSKDKADLKKEPLKKVTSSNKITEEKSRKDKKKWWQFSFLKHKNTNPKEPEQTSIPKP
ncbi:MAG: hypothetical protein Q8928_10365 [Bacteroidota bacterium]|nr:hypothetical protein [Bacteroidota bacterium]